MRTNTKTATKAAAAKGGNATFLKVAEKYQNLTVKQLCERNQVQTPAQLREEVLFRMLRMVFLKLKPTEEDFELLYVQETLFKIAGKAL